jgi:predicted RNase H-like HicB family nuclease
MKYRLHVQVQPLEEGGYLAVCPRISGCHAEGATIGEAIDNLQSVTQVLYDLCREQGLTFISDAPEASVDRITWQIEVSPALLVAV